jgi:hypothetical protein
MRGIARERDGSADEPLSAADARDVMLASAGIARAQLEFIREKNSRETNETVALRAIPLIRHR